MRRLSDYRKTELLLISLRDKVNVKSFCEKYGISRSTYYRHRKQVLEAIVQLILVQSARPSVGNSRRLTLRRRYWYRLK